MAECSECGKQTMSFTCHYCGEKFCSEHRLPENHDCEGLDSGKKDEYMQSSDQPKQVKKSSEQGSADSSNKWFKDKNLKEEKRTRKSRVMKNSLWSDISYTLKHNYTLSIIIATSALFFLGEIVPLLQYGAMLFPNIEPSSALQAGLPAQEAAANVLGYEPTLLNQPWGIITVMIAHGSLVHLFANMVTLYFFGSALEKSIGQKDFLKFYIGTGILASIAYIVFSNILYLLHGASISGVSTLSPAVGASGAVVAAVGAVAMLYPDAEVMLYFVIPMKIQTAVKIFGAIETVNLVAKLAGFTLPVIGGFASSAHLAGLFAGVLLGRKLRDRYGGRARINIFQ